MKPIFFIVNDETGEYAAEDSFGEHDGKRTSDLRGAKSFDTRAAAYDFSQNFGPAWRVEEE